MSEDRDATPESRGLLAVAEGFHLLELGDHRQLELSLPVYDALYAWCKHEVGPERSGADEASRRSASSRYPAGGSGTASTTRVTTWLGDSAALMYVAHTGADRVDVIDCGAREFMRSINGLPGVAGGVVHQGTTTSCSHPIGDVHVSACSVAPMSLWSAGSCSGHHPNGLAYDPERVAFCSASTSESLSASAAPCPSWPSTR